jgi:F5/8 type C domain
VSKVTCSSPRRFAPAPRGGGNCLGAARRQLLALLCLLPLSAVAQPRVLDDFRDHSAWRVTASDQVQASAARAADGALCLHYDFGRVSGYAVLSRSLPLELPAHYTMGLRLRGSGGANALQFKLVDASGDNVWWVNRPGYRPPAQSTELLFRQRHIEFAWGPTSDRTLRRAQTLELVVASAEGGAGELCFERLSLNTLAAPQTLPPARASASSSLGGASPALAIDGRADTAWRSAGGGRQYWQLDFGAPRELAGVMLRFDGTEPASDFELQGSLDGVRWRSLRQVRGSTRELHALWWPEGDAGVEVRHLRLLLQRGPMPQYALAELQAMSPQQWPNWNAALMALAKASPRGHFPRAFVGEQNYWTVVGVDGGGADAALISEDGAIEPHRGGPSLEPFVIDESGRIHSFADVHRGRRRGRHGPFATGCELHAHPHRLRAFALHAGARAAPVAGQPTAAVPEHARWREPGAPAQLATRHAAT